MDGAGADAVNGCQRVGVARLVEDALDHVQLALHERRAAVVGGHLAPVRRAVHFADERNEILVHDLEHVAVRAAVKVQMRLHARLVKGDLAGEMQREAGGDMVDWLPAHGSLNAFLLGHQSMSHLSCSMGNCVKTVQRELNCLTLQSGSEEEAGTARLLAVWGIASKPYNGN